MRSTGRIVKGVQQAILLHGGTCRSDGNMGDALMLRAVVEKMQHFVPDGRFAVKPGVGAYADRARWGFHQLLWEKRWSRLSGTLGRYFLHRYRDTFGIVAEGELDLVIDFMGFRYGDVGPNQTELAARETARWEKAEARIVFLPQAFGPFSTERVRGAMREVLTRAALVFARDRESERHLRELGSGSDRIRRAPDFTIPLRPPRQLTGERCDVLCIVPNRWMVERTCEAVSRRYVDFLSESSRICRSHGLETELVLHSRFQDEDLADEICRRIGGDVEVVYESDPMLLKARLGRARIVLGSRYHGLVGALSQGVPGIGTSWSHKYAGLFEDFESPEMLLSPADNAGVVKERIETTIRHESAIRCRLESAAERLSGEVDRMWEQVRDALGDKAC